MLIRNDVDHLVKFELFVSLNGGTDVTSEVDRGTICEKIKDEEMTRWEQPVESITCFSDNRLAHFVFFEIDDLGSF